MLRQTLALSLLFVLSSQAMNDSIKVSRDDIMNEFYLASKENRSPSPIVIKEMEEIADEAFAQGDSDLLVTGAQYLSKGTLLRMSDGCVQQIRFNVLFDKSNTQTLEILRAINRNLQKGD